MAAPSQVIPPLHLTPENKEAIRALVRRITPHFEEELWEQVRIRENAHREAQLDELRNEISAVTRRAFAPQAAASLYSTSPIIQSMMNRTAAMAPPTILGPISTEFQKAWDEAKVKPGPVVYEQQGTGFTVYDPQAQALMAQAGLAGLTLKK